MSDNYEKRIIAYEHARNKAMDEWFNARPSIERSQDFERVYEGGFRMAYAVQQDTIAALREALEKLARLGNGDHYGNSTGNDIAKAALNDSL